MMDFIGTPQCSIECPERLTFPTPLGSDHFALCESHHQWWQATLETPDELVYVWSMIENAPDRILGLLESQP